METRLIKHPGTSMQTTSFPQAIKRVLVKFSGGIKQPQEVLFGPGATTQDILNHLGLPSSDYSLSRGSGDSTFGIQEPVYDKLIDGDLLFVTSRVDAGIFI